MTELCFVGQCVLDQVFGVATLNASGGKQVAGSFDSRVGGLAANAALATLALTEPQHGPRISLLSAIGDDAAGLALQALLRHRGLQLDTTAGARTAVSAVLVDARGERQIHNFRGDALNGAEQPKAQRFAQSAGVLADPRWPEAAALALGTARQSGRPAVLDGETAQRDVLRRLAPLSNWCVFSRSGLQAWAGADDADDEAGAEGAGALQQGLDAVAATAPGTEVIVTLGAAGALWRRPDGHLQHLPAFTVQARDTNGAGDVLHGALLLALAEGLPAAAAVRRAMAAAALACLGAMPSRPELDKFLEIRR